jgi:hypothetical protein
MQNLPHAAWIDQLSPRERDEIDFAIVYATSFGHGTPGHLDLTLIASLANKLDEEYSAIIPGTTARLGLNHANRD